MTNGRRTSRSRLASRLAVMVAVVVAAMAIAGDDGELAASAGTTTPPAPATITPPAAPAARVVVGQTGTCCYGTGEILARPGGGMVLAPGLQNATVTGADGSALTTGPEVGSGLVMADGTGHLAGIDYLPSDAVTTWGIGVLDPDTTVQVGVSGDHASVDYPPGGFVSWVHSDGSREQMRHLAAFAAGVGTTARAMGIAPDDDVLVAAYTYESIDDMYPLDDVGIDVRTLDGTVLAHLPGPAHLMRFSADGAFEWSRPIYDVFDIAVGDDGTMVLLGRDGLRELAPDGSVRWRSGAIPEAWRGQVDLLADGDIVVSLPHSSAASLTTPLGTVTLPAPPTPGAYTTTVARLDRSGGPTRTVHAAGYASTQVRSDGSLVVGVRAAPDPTVTDAADTTITGGAGRAYVALLDPALEVLWHAPLPTAWDVSVGFDGAGHVVAGVAPSSAGARYSRDAGWVGGHRAWLVFDGAATCPTVTFTGPASITATTAATATLTGTATGACTTPAVPVEARLLDASGTEVARAGHGIGGLTAGGSGTVDVSVPIPAGTTGPLTLEVSAPWHGGAPITIPVTVAATATTTTTQPPTTTTTAPPSPPCQPSVRSVEQGIVGAGAVFAPHLSVRVASTIPCIVGPERFDLTLDPTWDLSGLDDPWPSRVVGPGHLQWMGASAVGTTRWSGSTWYHVPLPSGPWQAGEAVATVTLTPDDGDASTASVKVGDPTYCRPSPAGIEVIPTAPYPRVRVDVTPPDPADCTPLEFEVEAVTSPRWGLGHPWFHWPREGRASRTSSPPEFELQEPRWWSGETEMTVTFDTSYLIPSRSPQSATFRLGASGTATVGGRLTDGAGDPAAGVLVSAYAIGDHWRTGRHATTDADGRYTLAIPAGAPTAVRVVDPSGRFRSGWLPGQRVIALADGFIPADGSTTTIDATLVDRDTGSITGTVTVGGAPRAGLWVIVGREGHLDSTVTDADGRYRLDDVPEGRRTLLVADPTIATGWGYRRLQTQLLTLPTSVTVTAGNETVRDIRAA